MAGDKPKAMMPRFGAVGRVSNGVKQSAIGTLKKGAKNILEGAVHVA